MMQEDKRHFFRIRDEIFLSYQQIDASSMAEKVVEEHFPDTQSLALLTELRRLDLDAQISLNAIAEHHRPTADYIATINRKIDLLATHFIGSTLDLGNTTPTRVNISEGGIAFESSRPFYTGTLLAMRILFLPNYLGVCTYARVTRCETRENHNLIAASFLNLDENRRHILARQIMQAQLAERRKHKEDLEKSK